jgi:hypothetical protein
VAGSGNTVIKLWVLRKVQDFLLVVKQLVFQKGLHFIELVITSTV